LSVDHASGAGNYGVYFNFWNSEVDAMVGNTSWSGSNFYVINTRTNYKGRVILWRNPNGGTVGDGHGRFDGDPNPSGYKWEVGDGMHFSDYKTECISNLRSPPNCDTCPDSYYDDGNSNCPTCLLGCSTCTNGTSCTGCSDGYFNNGT
jgi:hypothetical protein